MNAIPPLSKQRHPASRLRLGPSFSVLYKESTSMTTTPLLRRLRLAACGLMMTFSAASMAADKVTFLTSWYAQAEHGGFYQALAKGIYQKAGLDVNIKNGGPQVNGMQLLTSGQADFLMGYDLEG